MNFVFSKVGPVSCPHFIFVFFMLGGRDKPLLASQRDKYEAWVMVVLAILSSVVAVTTNIFNLIDPA